jgi:hypothetical protein
MANGRIQSRCRRAKVSLTAQERRFEASLFEVIH